MQGGEGGGGGAPLIIQDAFILKRARVQIIVFTPQIIRGRHIVRPDGTSSRRNMGQLALIFRDQCVAGPLSIWGPGLASGVGSVDSRANYWSVYRSAGWRSRRSGSYLRRVAALVGSPQTNRTLP